MKANHSIKIVIRPEVPEDYDAIRLVNQQAFNGMAEANLVELLRARGKAIVSLVALLEHQIVGHILFSPASIEPPCQGIQIAGLAPMAVLPRYQNRGIGTKLVDFGLQACRERHYDIVVVLGHPNFYLRFGFQRASALGIDNEYGADEAFMVMELRPDVLVQVSGLVRYALEFLEAGC